jgi:hypothetical protein
MKFQMGIKITKLFYCWFCCDFNIFIYTSKSCSLDLTSTSGLQSVAGGPNNWNLGAGGPKLVRCAMKNFSAAQSSDFSVLFSLILL